MKEIQADVNELAMILAKYKYLQCIDLDEDEYIGHYYDLEDFYFVNEFYEVLLDYHDRMVKKYGEYEI